MSYIRFAIVHCVVACALVAGLAWPAAAQSPATARAAYQNLLGRERALTSRRGTPSVAQIRALIAKYEHFAGQHARTGYADNAIWQAAQLASMLGSRTKKEADRRTARRLLELLVREYPSSSLVNDARAALKSLAAPKPPTARAGRPPASQTAARATAPKPARAAAAKPTAPPGQPRETLVLESRQVTTDVATPALSGDEALAEALGSVSSPARRAGPASRPLPTPQPEPGRLVTPAARRAEPGPEPRPTAPQPSESQLAEAQAADDAETDVARTTRSEADADRATLTEVRRAVLPELVRVTLELSREVSYKDEKTDRPARVSFDLPGTVAATALQESVLTYTDDVVREIGVVTGADRSTRVVVDLAGAERYTVFTLYNPYRVVIDVFRKGGPRAMASSATTAAPRPRTSTGRDRIPASTAKVPAPSRDVPGGAAPAPVAPATPTAPNVTTTAIVPDDEKTADVTAAARQAPDTPETTSNGSFSLARQLGLGVSRVVIDPGHGGHDPGALGKKVTEAQVVLDVALRLEKLLERSPAFEVVLTRRTDKFVPLEQRTALANRERADLFLSIHANASRRPDARGVETYVLNFASNPEAEAVAARENAASGRSMHHLTDIVKAIALNNKLDESREFARIVQGSLVEHLEDGRGTLRDLGVKQAPFVVLIGAGMPSVLAEISFITNATDAQLLRTGAYRQKVAESLCEAILKYQRTLKATQTVAAKDE